MKKREMAERTGLEPATPGVTGRYSNRLNYRSALEAGHSTAFLRFVKQIIANSDVGYAVRTIHRKKVHATHPLQLYYLHHRYFGWIRNEWEKPSQKIIPLKI
jgi:hypothetical protein